jgi:hypothetical protein
LRLIGHKHGVEERVATGHQPHPATTTAHGKHSDRDKQKRDTGIRARVLRFVAVHAPFLLLFVATIIIVTAALRLTALRRPLAHASLIQTATLLVIYTSFVMETTPEIRRWVFFLFDNSSLSPTTNICILLIKLFAIFAVFLLLIIIVLLFIDKTIVVFVFGWRLSPPRANGQKHRCVQTTHDTVVFAGGKGRVCPQPFKSTPDTSLTAGTILSKEQVSCDTCHY